MRNIFRNKALEKLSNPEELEGAVQIINIKTWILLLLFILITFALFFWLSFNTINQQVKAKGLIIKPSSLIIIHALNDGFVENISVNNSDSISEGHYLFNLIPVDKKNKISQFEKEIFQLSNSSGSNTLSVQTATEKIRNSINELILSSSFFSPSKGTVFELNVSEGDFVRTGDKLLTIERESVEPYSTSIDKGTLSSDTSLIANQPLKSAKYNFSVIGIVPAEIINSIKIGNKVLIAPHNIDVKEYGYLIGKLEKIANYPISLERKKMLSKDNPLIGNILQNEFFEISVTPVLDSHGNYSWTSQKGLSIDFIRAAYCELNIITESKSILSFIVK